ncbi:MAG: hypothetical protein GKR88_05140 [Flavobacteriaceae bacterium]|nr:MAG: hypothetical protein GKR88_05140 [Flavobacteriaceae bacterium]
MHPFEGMYSFLKSYQLVIVSGAKDPISQSKISSDKYAHKEMYYYLINDEINKLKLNKKGIVKVFGKENFTIVKKYAKKQKLSFRDEKDVIHIFTYYNSQLK